MRIALAFAAAAILGLTGCASIPPVNTSTISQTPASAQQFAKAKNAVRICSKLPNAKAMFDGFEAIGYRSPLQVDRTTVTELPGGGKRVVVPNVLYDDGSLLVQASEHTCYVGLRGMTPQQSYQLAQVLVRRFDVATNEELGQGLSDHAVQAWQAKTYPSRAILIAAHKTWPWDRGNWPDTPGAAVTLQTD